MNATDAASSRLHALDAVRGGALLLGVLLHATLSFMPGDTAWLVADPSRSTALALLFFAIHLFRMTLFFVLAGFFARLLCQRLGTLGFMRDRLRRIAGPLLLFWPLVMLGIAGVLLLLAGDAARRPPPPAYTAGDFPLAHLWFLWVLLLFYAALLPLRALLLSLDRGGLLRRGLDALAAWATRPLLGLLLLAPPAALVLALQPGWTPWHGVPTPDRNLVGNAPAWVAYGLAFVFGWLLQRQQRLLLPRLALAWRRHALLALLLLLVWLPLLAAPALQRPLPWGGTKLGLAALYAASAWAICLAAIALALRFLDSASAGRRYLADAAYWIYIAHLPVVLALQALAAHSTAPWWLKFPALLGLSLLLLFASYHWAVRPTWVGALLNGRRLPRGGPPA